MKIKNIISYLEELAPLYLQEDYDNSGLIVGCDESEVSSVLISLDCTEDVLSEAISNKCNLIITHHPLIFSSLKRLNGKNYVERILINAIKNEIAIYSMHTNLDNIFQGVNAQIANKIQLKNTKILKPKKDILRQLVVYCPYKHSQSLKDVLFNAGAGAIGNYTNCSFSSSGKGTFKAGEKTDPYIGNKGELHVENEDRIEVIYPKYKEKEIINAMHSCHPYEEVAYQIYLIDNVFPQVGSGIIGDLTSKKNVNDFLNSLKDIFSVNMIRCSPIIKKEIQKIAVCGGSGSFLIEDAKKVGADMLITSDIKYHQFFDAGDNMILVDIGHYESEQFTKDLIFDLLRKKFTKFAFLLSKVNTNPINYL